MMSNSWNPIVFHVPSISAFRVLEHGGNRNAAATQLEGLAMPEAVAKLYAAVDEYLDS